MSKDNRPSVSSFRLSLALNSYLLLAYKLVDRLIEIYEDSDRLFKFGKTALFEGKIPNLLRPLYMRIPYYTMVNNENMDFFRFNYLTQLS